MYTYNDFDRRLVRERAVQFRDQLERWLDGRLTEDEFRPLRLQNGWYIQRYAPMARIAVPYGELSSRQLRALARIGRQFDRGYGHFTTRQNLQFNWIPIERAADVMDALAEVDMHGIQTSGNCIRNITADALAGIAPDEVADPRPFCELLRQWASLHPEFAFLPRKFKFAVTGAAEDRAATLWHDVGLHLVKNGAGELGFTVYAGGGMGRTPVVGRRIRDFLPWDQLLNYATAIVRVYNLRGRRDNKYKARIKILVRALGDQFTEEVEREYAAIVAHDGAPETIPQAEYDRVAACFPVRPAQLAPAGGARPIAADERVAYERWLTRNVQPHRLPGLRAVTLSLKRLGQAPGDVTSDQMEAAAKLADTYSAGELRTTHTQDLLLPWVHAEDLPELWRQARAARFATPTVGLLTDMITCPGGDFCGLANARSIPIAQSLLEHFDDLDYVYDLGPLDLHISGCMNACGHHHTGHIGILGVDKDGQEWYQVSVGGSDGSTESGPAAASKIIGPSFAASEVTPAIDAVVKVYLREREEGELFIDTARRIGVAPFREATDAVRHVTGRKEEATA